MTAESSLKAAVLASSFTTRTELRKSLESPNLATVVAESAEYCSEDNWTAIHEFKQRQPDLILVEARGIVQTVEAVRALRQSIPETWILVVSDTEDPHLIVECIRAGAREFLFKPITTNQIQRALERFQAESRASDKHPTGTLYCVTSAKGGSGATSLAINLAAVVAKSAATKVALIDLDNPLGDAAPYLNLKPDFTVTDAFSAGPRLDPMLLASYLKQASGIAVLPAPKEIATQDIGLDALARTLRVATEAYTHVFVDVPNLFDDRLLSAMAPLTEDFLVVLTPELPALWRTRRLLSFLQQGGVAGKVRVILNRSQSNDELNRKDIEKTLEMEIFWNLPNDYRRSIEAVNAGKPLVSFNHSGLSRSYTELAQKITGFPKSLEKKRGILGLFR